MGCNASKIAPVTTVRVVPLSESAHTRAWANVMSFRSSIALDPLDQKGVDAWGQQFPGPIDVVAFGTEALPEYMQDVMKKIAYGGYHDKVRGKWKKDGSTFERLGDVLIIPSVPSCDENVSEETIKKALEYLVQLLKAKTLTEKMLSPESMGKIKECLERYFEKATKKLNKVVLGKYTMDVVDLLYLWYGDRIRKTHNGWFQVV